VSGAPRSRHRIKITLALGLSFGLLAYLLASVDLRALGAQLARTEWGWVAAAAACGVLGLYARAVRWRYLFPPATNPPALVPAIMIGYMANNVLPLRAGELVRVWVVARRWHGGFWTAFATLVVERVLDSLALVLILGVLVLLVPVPAVFRHAALVVLAIDVAGVAALWVLAASPDTGRRLVAALARRWTALERRLVPGYDMFVHGLEGVRTLGHVPPLFAWTVVVWLLPAAAAWMTLRAVHLDLPWLAGWVVLAFVGLGISIPAAPGYFGVFHFAAAKAVELFGADPAAGVAFAIVMHATQYVAVTLVGWGYLLREGLTLTEAARAPAGADAPSA
jgi:glycosyltransferase 2 family protein